MSPGKNRFLNTDSSGRRKGSSFYCLGSFYSSGALLGTSCLDR